MTYETTIIQGTNTPIELTFEQDMTTCQKFSALLHKFGRELKRWELDDVEIRGETIYLPLTESETMEFQHDNAVLELKWLDESGAVQFATEIGVLIESRVDHTIMDGDSSG